MLIMVPIYCIQRLMINGWPKRNLYIYIYRCTIHSSTGIVLVCIIILCCSNTSVLRTGVPLCFTSVLYNIWYIIIIIFLVEQTIRTTCEISLSETKLKCNHIIILLCSSLCSPLFPIHLQLMNPQQRFNFSTHKYYVVVVYEIIPFTVYST